MRGLDLVLGPLKRQATDRGGEGMGNRRRHTDLLFLLWVTKSLRRHTEARPGNPTRMLVRLLFVWIGIGIFHKLLWHGLVAMPTGLWLFVGSALVFRVIRWYWRRLH